MVQPECWAAKVEGQGHQIQPCLKGLINVLSGY